jgi:hypothetical protein
LIEALEGLEVEDVGEKERPCPFSSPETRLSDE